MTRFHKTRLIPSSLKTDQNEVTLCLKYNKTWQWGQKNKLKSENFNPELIGRSFSLVLSIKSLHFEALFSENKTCYLMSICFWSKYICLVWKTRWNYWGQTSFFCSLTIKLGHRSARFAGNELDLILFKGMFDCDDLMAVLPAERLEVFLL